MVILALHCAMRACTRVHDAGQAWLRLGGSQASARCGIATMSVMKSAMLQVPRMATTTACVFLSSAMMYGNVPSVSSLCGRCTSSGQATHAEVLWSLSHACLPAAFCKDLDAPSMHACFTTGKLM